MPIPSRRSRYVLVLMLMRVPGSKRDPLADFESKCLPRAPLINLDEVANHDHPMKVLFPRVSSSMLAVNLFTINH